jgi:hypothetical protein
MGLRQWIKRLEHSASGELESFELRDGSRHYYDAAGGECFLHAMRCVRAESEGKPYPKPPQTIQALTSVAARDRGAALEHLATDTFPYDRQAFIERGELVERSMVASEAGKRLRYREGDDLHES